MRSIDDFEALAIDGQPVALSAYKGQVMLIVNTASACGFTPQFAGLEQLHQSYAAQGLVVLGFPCNQFGYQEPGTSEEIKTFCSTKYDVTFPLFEKIDVNGDNAHPLYKYLTDAKPGLLGTKDIKWNFTKFLVDRTGEPVARYAPQTKPEDLEDPIRRLL